MAQVIEQRVDVADGKFTVILRDDGTSDALRYGEEWPAVVAVGGIDNLHRALARDLIDLRDATENLIIAIGMGWDLEGVVDCAQRALGNPPR